MKIEDDRYGYNDERLIKRTGWSTAKIVSLILALIFLTTVFFFLNQKLIFGEEWISETYDHEHWRTNEGDTPTYGAWDFEAHVFKTKFIMENFPDFNYEPSWYLGFPLLKYYQSGFYFFTILIVLMTGFSVSKAALFAVMTGLYLAVMFTFILSYKFSDRIWASAFIAVSLMATNFITLRSYGWEPITTAFIFLYPLSLLIFFKKPLKPFRFFMVIILAITYLAHPLIWLTLLMTMGLYLVFIAAREKDYNTKGPHYIFAFIMLAIFSVLIGAVQFLPQITYEQVTSGSHMGVTYIPFYHVKHNVISLTDFIFDASNLKGPGFIVFSALLLVIYFSFANRKEGKEDSRSLFTNPVTAGMTFIVFVMILFYYAELYNIFPMNILRSVQYHRIIPEIVVNSCILIASMSVLIRNNSQKVIYYGVLIAFVLASFVVVYNTQTKWESIDDNDFYNKPEFVDDDFEGRMSFPYSEQSLSVRSSFNALPQVYGYYEQGITNSYADEIFSVSSGYHDYNLTMLYLKAANVGRLYVNTNTGKKNTVMIRKLSSLEYKDENERYAYYEIPLKNPEFFQAVSLSDALKVKSYEPGCRRMFKEEYCQSKREEFVTTDYEEQEYIKEYVFLTENPDSKAVVDVTKKSPEDYEIQLKNATKDTAIIVKMTYDDDFTARIDNEEIEITRIGPDFMLIIPRKEGDYTIELNYNLSSIVVTGMIISIISLVALLIIKSGLVRIDIDRYLKFKKGDSKHEITD